MNEEVLKVLEMVRSGRVTPQEGEKLLSALGVGAPDEAAAKAPATMLRMRIDVRDPDKKEDQAKVTVNIPLSLAKKMTGLVKMVPREARDKLDAEGVDLEGIDLKALIEMFENGELTEELVTIDTGDETKGARVRIYVD